MQLTACFQMEESAMLADMAAQHDQSERALREVYTRFLLGRLKAVGTAAEFSRQTGISKPEISAVVNGERMATEGQILKLCSTVGPPLSEAMSRMALIARDVEQEVPREPATPEELEEMMQSPLRGRRIRAAQLSEDLRERRGGIRAAAHNDRAEQQPQPRERHDQNPKR